MYAINLLCALSLVTSLLRTPEVSIILDTCCEMKLDRTAIFDQVRNSSKYGPGMEFGKLEALAHLKRTAAVHHQQTIAWWGYQPRVNQSVDLLKRSHDFTSNIPIV